MELGQNQPWETGRYRGQVNITQPEKHIRRLYDPLTTENPRYLHNLAQDLGSGIEVRVNKEDGANPILSFTSSEDRYQYVGEGAYLSSGNLISECE